MTLSNAYSLICNQINEAVSLSNRAAGSVKLIAVSKTKPEQSILELAALGQMDFGENYVQEFLTKKAALPAKLHWHFIGHLQSRKARDVVGQALLIHSVDSLSLIQEIQKRAAAQNIVQKILFQVDLGKEPTKSGLDPNQLLEATQLVATMNNLQLCGLMTLPPFNEDPEQTRPFFKELANWFQRINQAGDIKTPLTELSMGMSHDFVSPYKKVPPSSELGQHSLASGCNNQNNCIDALATFL